MALSRPESWPRDRAARGALTARGQRRAASPLELQATVPAADADRQTQPANAPGWPWLHWRAVADAEWPRAALRKVSARFSPAAQRDRPVRSERPASRQRWPTVRAQALYRNEPGAGRNSC